MKRRSKRTCKPIIPMSVEEQTELLRQGCQAHLWQVKLLQDLISSVETGKLDWNKVFFGRVMLEILRSAGIREFGFAVR